MGKMSRWCIAIPTLILLVSRGFFVEARDKPNLAMMDLAMLGGVPANVAPYLQGEILHGLAQTGKYEVVSVTRRDEILAEMDFQQTGVCNYIECAVRVGETLGVEKVIFGEINRIFGMHEYVLTLSMVDVTTMKFENRAKVKFKESMAAATVAAKQVVKQISGIAPSPPVPDIVPSQPAEGENIIYISAGKFTMGSKDGRSSERPVHTVYLKAYYMDKYEVTNGQYGAFMKATGKSAPKEWNDIRFNESNQPVVGVSWYDAEAYCKWAGKRLPTEAEWEKAARGTDARVYPWGNDFDCGRGNFDDETKYDRETVPGGAGCDGYVEIAPVGRFPSGASPYRVHDMAGNAWEWVNDWYDRAYYARSPNKNPTGPDSGKYRVLRGGSWNYGPDYVRAAFRGRSEPDYRDDLIGFRCVKDVE